LAANADAAGLTLVVRAEQFGARVGDALERAAVLVVGAVGIFGTTGETGVIAARAARARDALLCLGTRGIETRQQTLAIDADARIATLEIELATEGRRVGIVFERIETKTVVRARRPHGAVVLLFALADATKRRADFPDGTVRSRHAKVTLRRWLGVTLVSLA
jgi:hypothetical protein